MTENGFRRKWDGYDETRRHVAIFVRAMRFLVRKRGRSEYVSRDEQNVIELCYSDEHLIIRHSSGRCFVIRKDTDRTLLEVMHGRVRYAWPDPKMLDHAIRQTVLDQLAK